MRCLHICPRESFSGLEMWVLEMMRFQKNSGHSVALVALEGSPLAEKAKHEGIRVFSTRKPLGALALMTTLGDGFDKFNPQILHFHNSQDFKSASPWIALMRLRVKFKVILQLHIWMSHSKRDPLHTLLYRMIDQLWCSSEPARKSVNELLPIAQDKVRIIHYGRPVVKMHSGFLDRKAARETLHVPDDATVIGTVSRIDKGKGIGELFDGALSQMKSNPSLHLVVIGGPTPEANALKFSDELNKRLSELPEELKTRMHFLGNVPDSYRVMKAFDIFALPTYRECFSLALLEAQLAELPCLATNAGGSPELVRENVTGWLCEPESTESFEFALVRALGDGAKWNEFGKAGHERVKAEFDSSHVLNETIEGYEKLLAEKAKDGN